MASNPWTPALVGETWVTGRIGKIAIAVDCEQTAVWLSRQLNELMVLRAAFAERRCPECGPVKAVINELLQDETVAQRVKRAIEDNTGKGG